MHGSTIIVNVTSAVCRGKQDRSFLVIHLPFPPPPPPPPPPRKKLISKAKYKSHFILFQKFVGVFLSAYGVIKVKANYVMLCLHVCS